SANVTVVSLFAARHSGSQSQRLDSRKFATQSMQPFNRPTNLQTRQKSLASLSTRRKATFSPLLGILLLPRSSNTAPMSRQPYAKSTNQFSALKETRNGTVSSYTVSQQPITTTAWKR